MSAAGSSGFKAPWCDIVEYMHYHSYMSMALLASPSTTKLRCVVQAIPWSRTAPLVGDVPTVKRRLPLRLLSGLRPADIADIVEHASDDEGEAILTMPAEA